MQAPQRPQEPPPHNESPNQRVLGSMFTEVLAVLDMPARRELREIVEHCHTRLSNMDSRGVPVWFFEQRDVVTQAIAARHLAHIAQPTCAPVQQTFEGIQAPGFAEHSLMATMDIEVRNAYVEERMYGCSRHCLELGYQYLHHLERPDLPIEETWRPLPEAEKVEERHVNADTQEGLSDEEMYSDDENSFCSQMSDVTHESALHVVSKKAVTDSSEPVDVVQGAYLGMTLTQH